MKTEPAKDEDGAKDGVAEEKERGRQEKDFRWLTKDFDEGGDGRKENSERSECIGLPVDL